MTFVIGRKKRERPKGCVLILMRCTHRLSHICKGRRMFMMSSENDFLFECEDNMVVYEVYVAESEGGPELTNISLHALEGTFSPRILRIRS